MKLKDGVVIAGLDLRMRPVLMIADDLWRFYGKELVVVRGLEGLSSASSLHPYGLAIDLRTQYLNGTRDRETISDELNKRLQKISTRYFVEFKGKHTHVEYRPYNLISIKGV